MKSDVDVIALQGIEFWSNVCDEEITLSMDDAESDDLGQVPTSLSQSYAKGALQFLIPILMQKLTQQVISSFFGNSDWGLRARFKIFVDIRQSVIFDQTFSRIR